MKLSEIEDYNKNSHSLIALKCQVCDREVPPPGPSAKPVLTGESVYMCKACWSIWYDGECDVAEIKRHSLHWPVDSYEAYRKSSYEEP